MKPQNKVLEVTDRELDVLFAACRYLKTPCVVHKMGSTMSMRITSEELSVLKGRIEQIRLDL